MICFRVVMIIVLLGYIEHPSSMLARQHPDGIVLTLQLCVCSYGVTHSYMRSSLEYIFELSKFQRTNTFTS
ncbi:hypothetical protein HanXRQr2_Chr09g0405701 [Helianthus annuus]|uniref:Secreted protein n=1 Tax=Helianthus annuus TaxID=4232 RepID=A0A9K3NA63_HELAN|nr:hypothetical protein HanXRQr2_Chr09g0405701 [Helianthus annuus]